MILMWRKWPFWFLVLTFWVSEQGLGITVFGMAYMFVHDGLVHKRFPVGPIANVPYLRKVAAAHQVRVTLTSFSARMKSKSHSEGKSPILKI